jgi:hypothetical protein
MSETAKIKVVYTGAYSGVVIQELGIEVARGVPFEAPREWFEERSVVEPWWEIYVPLKIPTKTQL